jgi:hypothetical protein
MEQTASQPPRSHLAASPGSEWSDMEAILTSTTNPTDLLNISDASLPYRFDRIFSAQGFGAKRLAKKRLKLIQQIDPVVQTMLCEGERVQLVSWGVEYSFLEQIFMGIWSHLINRCALVLTDRRILIIQIDSRRRVQQLKTQLRFECIESLAKRTFGYIGFVLRNERKLYITGMPRKDRKAIKALVLQRLQTKASNAIGQRGGLENLCPKCGNRVIGFPDRCKQCATAFKSARKAGLLSLVFPGLGDLYLGHRGLGAFEIFAGVLSWSLIVLPMAFAAWQGEADWILTAGVAAAVFVFVHVTDFWITRRVGFKGIYPAD